MQMTMTKTVRRLCALLCVILSFGFLSAPARAQAGGQTETGAGVILTRQQAAAIMPATVFYRGQTASVQGRNSTGLKLSGDKLVLVATVDTSGYSSAIQQSYQAYLLTEVPLEIGGKTLVPGAYGIGFLAGDQFVAMDLGGHALLTVASTKDAALARPNPMQIVADPATQGQFRLYSGRSFVSLSPSALSQ